MSTTKIIQFPTQETPAPAKQTDGRRKKRADGRQQVSYVDDSGKRRFFYGKSIREATQKMNDDKQQRTQGIDPQAAKQPLETWAKRWLDVYGQNAGHTTNYSNRHCVNKLIAAMGSVPIQNITESDIQLFATAHAHLSKSTVTKLKQVVNGVFGRAAANGLIRGHLNPCSGVKWNHRGGGTHRALSDSEKQLIADNWQAHRAGLWAMLMLWAGLRIGEALALSWTDIDFDRGEINIHTARHFEGNASVDSGTTKNGESRTVPIFPPLAQALASIPMPPPTALVCTSGKGLPVTCSALQKNWKSFQNTLANIQNGDTKTAIAPGRRSDMDSARYTDAPRHSVNIRTHDLRHTFCTMLYDAGVDIKTAQFLMGHKTPDMTIRLYTHLTDARRDKSIADAADYMQKMVSKPKDTTD